MLRVREHRDHGRVDGEGAAEDLRELAEHRIALDAGNGERSGMQGVGFARAVHPPAV